MNAQECKSVPAVSVVMPVYNSMPYLREAMDSALAQTLREIEIICVDDGSTDGSLAVLQDYAARDARIRVLRHLEETEGAAAARNMGMGVATGEYLAFLDSDDVFEPQMLEKAYRNAKETDADIVLFDVWFNIDGKDVLSRHGFERRRLPETDVFSPSETASTLLEIPNGAAWNNLFRRAFVMREQIQFDSIRCCDDIGFVFAAYACAQKISVLKERLLHYRFFRTGSQMDSMERRPLAAAQAFLLLRKKLESKGLLERYHATFLNRALENNVYVMSKFKSEDAFQTLYDQLRHRYLQVFGCFDIPASALSPRARKIFAAIRDKTAMGFLLEWKNELIAKIDYWECIEQAIGRIDAPLIVYGAGDHGQLFLGELLKQGLYPIAAWVDRDYQRIGYPVQSPAVLRNIEAFSYVIVTPLAQKVYDAIRSDLMEMRVPAEKILWAKDIEPEEWQ